ncbi:NADPH:quinone reductase-like Zn-dependent oxidoreductase [Nocardia transvalensis]|uniref:NADPH:quinone reductase-like Zn-dependent oxidoreductase n=1 Tax=Nocardia transvalensis TaxID=37333 RepID=A0A7W9PN09_9NOCA|nr:NADP-dependent oxidoreductase [Nocardia transvalensis]MBB5918518.1 NADPH:quinone reductase-like Zn-dependent oxidoreductase [Nocardia transvalensis]
MAQAVRFDRYGDIDVLDVVEVPDPVPGSGEVVVAVVAAGINPGETKIRSGALHDRWPATFPSGQGSDFAGRISAVGSGVSGLAVGDEVIGFTHKRASHATHVVASVDQVAPKPAEVPWDVAGSLFVAGTTAFAAVRAVEAGKDDVVVVSAAAGGVGSVAVQLLRARGATVIGIAGPDNQEWLRSLGVVPVGYGDGLAERIRAVAPSGVDAFLDFHGDGYVDLALELGVGLERINTVIDFAAVQKYGVKSEGNGAADTIDVLAELADLVAAGTLIVPIAATYPLAQVRDAYRELEQGHTRGKIVLHP